MTYSGWFVFIGTLSGSDQSPGSSNGERGYQPHVARRRGGGRGGHEGGGEVNLTRREKGGVDLISHKTGS